MAPLLEKDNPGSVKTAREVFGKAKGDDAVRLTAEGGKDLRISLRVTPQVLNFFALTEQAKKARQNPPGQDK